MSIDMYLGESDGQATSMKNLANFHIQGYKEIQKAITNFTNEIENLKGEAYDSARSFYSEVLIPLSKGAEVLMEKTREGVVKLPAEYREQVDLIDLKQSELEEKISQAEQQVIVHRELISNMSSLTIGIAAKTAMIQNQEGILNSIESSKAVLEDKLQKLLNYSETSKNFFLEIERLEIDFQRGLKQANSSWNAKTGTFNLSTSQNWAVSLLSAHEKLKSKRGELSEKDKKAYVKNLQEQYGFDENTAKLILKVRQGIDKKFSDKSQKERDYLLLRVLGGIIYSGGKWDNTAGSLKDYFTSSDINDILVKEVGLSSKEANILQYAIIKQHDFSWLDENEKAANSSGRKKYEERLEQYKKYNNIEGKTDSEIEKEFMESWYDNTNRYKNKTDFSHQYITMATHLNPKWALAHLWGGRNNAEDLAGWKGDTTTAAFAEPSIKNDDYKADLDSVNVITRMETDGGNFIEESNKYYKDLVDGKTNRAKEFSKNKNLSSVKKSIYDYIVPSKSEYIGPNIDRNKSLTEEEKKAYLKEKYPDSYNFIRSLEDGLNELHDYSKE